jgi:hypothetical protein
MCCVTLRGIGLLALLNVLSVGLGVAVYLAIQIANHSANRAFSATIDLVAGKAALQVGGPLGGLPDETFPTIANHPGVSAATPLVRGIVTLPDLPANTCRSWAWTSLQTPPSAPSSWLTSRPRSSSMCRRGCASRTPSRSLRNSPAATN